MRELKNFSIKELVDELHDRRDVVMLKGIMTHTSGAYLVDKPNETIIMIIKIGINYDRNERN